MTETAYWHAICKERSRDSGGVLDGDFRGEYVCVTSAWDVAMAYANEDASLIYRVDVAPRNPLVIEDPESFRDLWKRMLAQHGGPGKVFWGEDGSHNRLCDMLKAEGYDFVDYRESAFAGDLGFEWLSSIIGDVQSVVLDKSIIMAVTPEAEPPIPTPYGC